MHMMDLCTGAVVHYELEGSEPRCSEECESIIGGLDGEQVQVCLFRRCCASHGLLKTSVCSLIAAIVFHRFHRIF